MPRVSDPSARLGAVRAQPRLPQASRRVPPPLPDRPGRWKLVGRRCRRWLRPPALASALVVMLGASLVAANVLTHGASLRDQLGLATAGLGFRIATIQIDGNAKTPRDDILHRLRADIGSPTLAVALDQARAAIEGLPWVRAARVERVLPDTIRITLTERSPVALWQNQGHFVLIDRSGKTVTDSDYHAFAGTLPLVVGPGAPEAAVALLDLLASQPDLRGRMVAAVRVGGRRWNLCMNSGADVLLPEGAEAIALTRLAELQASKQLLERPLREIDLRLPDQLRLRPQTDGGCGGAQDGRPQAIQPAPPPASPPARKAT
jgi:cell division protein FtsQ